MKNERNVKQTPSNRQFETKVQSLITLLGDDDRSVRKIAWSQIFSCGNDAVPYLENAVNSDLDGTTRMRSARLLKKMHRKSLIDEFRVLALWDDADIDLEDGAYLIAKTAFPNLEKKSISGELDWLAELAGARIDEESSVRDKIKALNSVIYRREGFHGNVEDYHKPNNSFINKVLETRAGIPITLSIIYLSVAKRLKLPVRGVNTPIHYMCVYETDEEPIFINTFDRGRMMTLEKCLMFLHGLGAHIRHTNIYSISRRETLQRMLHNLVLAYHARADLENVTFIKKLLHILKYYGKNKKNNESLR